MADTYKKMTEGDRKIIAKMSILNGKSPKEIAEITGFPRRSVAHFLARKNANTKSFWEQWDLYVGLKDVEVKIEATVDQLNEKVKIKDLPIVSDIPCAVMLTEPEEATQVFHFSTRDGWQSDNGLKIVVIPDTQVKPNVDLRHISAAGRYILEHKPDVVVVIGDWWDMPSLNRFGSKLELDGRRVLEDIQCGKDAMEAFLAEFYNIDGYRPRMVFTVGNHDPQVRIPRVLEELPHLEGLLVDDTDAWLTERGFEVYKFLDVCNIEGVRFSHYFQNPHSAKRAPLGGQIDTMLKNAGFSFVQGHTQGLKMGKHYLADGTRRVGIVAGSFYSHDEAFMGGQGNEHWRGIIQLNEVKDGGCDICELSMNYLMRKHGV